MTAHPSKPEFPGHVWGYDFVLEPTQDGVPFPILNVINEYTRECLAVRVPRRLDHEDVQECLTELFCSRGVPAHLRSDNGPEFIANALRAWLDHLKVKPLLLNQVTRGKTVMLNRSTARCAKVVCSVTMNC